MSSYFLGLPGRRLPGDVIGLVTEDFEGVLAGAGEAILFLGLQT